MQFLIPLILGLLVSGGAGELMNMFTEPGKMKLAERYAKAQHSREMEGLTQLGSKQMARERELLSMSKALRGEEAAREGQAMLLQSLMERYRTGTMANTGIAQSALGAMGQAGGQQQPRLPFGAGLVDILRMPGM